MQVLLTWKSQGLRDVEASQHWTHILETWRKKYQPLTEHPLHLATTNVGTLFLGLLYIPDMFCEWQEFYEDESSAVAWAGIAHNLVDMFPQKSITEVNAHFVSKLHESGDCLLRELNGRFVVAVLHRSNRTLRVIVNNYGLTPCFWTTGKYGTAIGTRIAPLLDLAGVRCVPNRRALLQMFAIYWCVGNQTPFEGVFQLGQGREAVLCEDRQMLQERCHTPPEYVLDNRKGLGKDYLQIGSEVFTSTIACQMRHTRKPLMNLTGGMDSRTIVTSVVALGHHPECDVSGEPDSREIRLASKVAEILDVTLHCLSPGNHYAEQIDHTLQMWSLWTEGMISVYHEFARSAFGLSPKLSQFYAKYRQVFSGVGGGMGKNFYYRREMLFENPSPQEVIARLKKLQFTNRWLTDEENVLIQSEFPSIIREAIRLGLTGHQLFDYFYWQERASHWGGYLLDMQQFGRHIFAPICSPMLTSVFFLMSVEERLLRAWHQYHLHRLCPALTTIPFIKPPHLKKTQKFIFHIHPTLYKTAYYLKQKVFITQQNPQKTLPERDREKIGAYFHPYLQKLLFSGDEWWPTLFEYEKGRKMWENFLVGKEAKSLWNLVTIELWARTFL